MIKHFCKIILGIYLTTLFISCKKDYLSYDISNGVFNAAQVWYSDRNTRAFLTSTYYGLSSPTSTASSSSLASRYNIDGSGSMLSEGSDEAISTNTASIMYNMINGSWSPTNLVDDNYAALYSYIRKTNMFIANVGNSAVYPQSDTLELKSEAYFLRAYFYFELLERYGGVPIVTRVLSPTDNLIVPKNSYDEVVAQIAKDCDSAVVGLPLANGALGDQRTPLSWDDGDRGRATQIAALALKCRTFLYAASPLNNPNNELSRWQAAADVANQIIQSKADSLLTGPNYSTFWDYDVPGVAFNSEVIFATAPLQINSVDQNNAPIGFNSAKGICNPTQDLVDAFETKTGYPITDARSGFNPQNPYSKRDLRLSYFILFNGTSFKGRAVKSYVGGSDNVLSNINSTKTGYYMRKFLSESATWNSTPAVTRTRPWIIFRYAEVLLNYAEALNEVQGPVQSVYDAVNAVRARVLLPGLPTGISQDSMRTRIQNERRVELCFEDHRFFDIRRWKLANTFLSGDIKGVNIQSVGGTLTYTYQVVGNRVWNDKYYYYPFPQEQVNKDPKLVQNPGY